MYHASFAPLFDFGPHQQVTLTKGGMNITPKTPIHDYLVKKDTLFQTYSCYGDLVANDYALRDYSHKGCQHYIRWSTFGH